MPQHDLGGQGALTALAVAHGVFAAGYAWAWLSTPRPKRRGSWPSLCFAAGSLLIFVALLPPLSQHAHHDLRAHMWQHLLLGMWGPIGIVLGKPVTTMLAALPPARARSVVALLHSSPVRALSHPVTALVLNIGGMALLYLTPLFARMHHDVVLHGLVHFHFLLAGTLFSWAVLGLEPAAGRRTSPVVRLLVLWAAAATHAVLGKAMYAYGYPRGTSFSLSETEAAAKIMYYGGDLSELVLVALLVAFWPRSRRAEPAGRRALGQTA